MGFLDNQSLSLQTQSQASAASTVKMSNLTPQPTSTSSGSEPAYREISIEDTGANNNAASPSYKVGDHVNGASVLPNQPIPEKVREQILDCLDSRKPLVSFHSPLGHDVCTKWLNGNGSRPQQVTKKPSVLEVLLREIKQLNGQPLVVFDKNGNQLEISLGGFKQSTGSDVDALYGSIVIKPTTGKETTIPVLQLAPPFDGIKIADKDLKNCYKAYRKFKRHLTKSSTGNQPNQAVSNKEMGLFTSAMGTGRSVALVAVDAVIRQVKPLNEQAIDEEKVKEIVKNVTDKLWKEDVKYVLQHQEAMVSEVEKACWAIAEEIKSKKKPTLEIREQNIVEFKGDVIVNAANSQLTRGDGVCGAIYNAAGEGNLRESLNTVKEKIKKPSYLNNLLVSFKNFFEPVETDKRTETNYINFATTCAIYNAAARMLLKEKASASDAQSYLFGSSGNKEKFTADPESRPIVQFANFIPRLFDENSAYKKHLHFKQTKEQFDKLNKIIDQNNPENLTRIVSERIEI